MDPCAAFASALVATQQCINILTGGLWRDGDVSMAFDTCLDYANGLQKALCRFMDEYERVDR
jgi:hypothetical protein